MPRPGRHRPYRKDSRGNHRPTSYTASSPSADRVGGQVISKAGESRFDIEILLIVVDEILIAQRADPGVGGRIMTLLVVTCRVPFDSSPPSIQCIFLPGSGQPQLLGKRVNVRMDGKQEVVEVGAIGIVRRIPA